MGMNAKDGSDGSEGSEGKEGGKDWMPFSPHPDIQLPVQSFPVENPSYNIYPLPAAHPLNIYQI